MKPSQDSLLAAWQKTLSDLAGKPAIFDPSGQVLRTFRQIEERAGAVDPSLRKLDPGDVVAIQIGNHPDWPSLLLTCLRRQLVVLPLEPGMSQAECERALKTCRARLAVTETGSVLTIRRIRRSSPEWEKPPPSLLKLTSGTTAAPRAIPFGSDQLLADCTQICKTMEITRRDLNFAIVPVSHSYGFSNLLTPLIARGVAMVLSRDAMPRAVLRDLERTGATVFPGTPIFYQAFRDIAQVPTLKKLRLCISAAAPLSIEVAQGFQKKFRKPIHSFYGSSECGGICYDSEGGTAEQGFVGKPMHGVNLEFLDPDSVSSQVRVHSKAVGDGYFPRQDEEKLGHGTFVPDDLLTSTPNGLRIVGRVSDVINVAGKKVNPAEVEAELRRYQGVKEVIVFGRASTLRNQEVAACVVASPNVCEADLLALCRKRLSQWQVPRRIFFVEQIPHNERGKTNRRELARLFGN